MADFPEYPLEADNYYELLGFTPLSNPTKEEIKAAYQVRYNSWIGATKIELREIYNTAIYNIGQAQKTLLHDNLKAKYNETLRKNLLRRLRDNIEIAVKSDRKLSSGEEKEIYEKGEKYGFSRIEVDNCINQVLKEWKAHRANETETPNFRTPQPSPITLEGQPDLEIVGKPEFEFFEVKLGHTKSDNFSIKNGGGGSLEAEIISSAAWLIASPTKIHQSQLPQTVTITVDPSKDKRCQHGFGETGDLQLIYNQGTETKSIKVHFSIEGFKQTVNRFTKISTGVSVGIVGLYLWYLLNVLNISGWGIFGMLVALGTGIYGYVAQKDWNKLNRNVAIAVTTVLILLASPTIFIAVLTIPLTYFASKFIFSRYPLKPQLSGIIPVSIFLFGWVSDGLINGDFQFPNFSKEEKIALPVEQPTFQIGTIIAKEGAKLRSGPSKNASAIGTVKKGETVKILQREREWYKVEYDMSFNQSRTGYIYSSLVEVFGLSRSVRPQQPIVAQGTQPESKNFDESKAVEAKTELVQITITSTPIGASVDIAGQWHGQTPDTLKVKSGSNIVLLTHPRYRDYRDTIIVQTDGNKNFHFKLESNPLLTGRWEGAMAGKPLIMVITSFKDSSVTGYTANSDSSMNRFSGVFDAMTNTIMLEEQSDKPAFGKFNGKLSGDGRFMLGTCIRSVNPILKRRGECLILERDFSSSVAKARRCAGADSRRCG